ncbi:MAG: Tox-REase-5 domain-containing protein [Bacteroidota bacterium]
MQDYYAFGMQMPGRKSSGGYRYGFNGKENDNEVKGEGNQQDYGMRIYDGRIGKFLSVDPLTKQYPELTPYQFASNSPIFAIDRDGLEMFGNNWIIDIWLEWKFGDPTGIKTLKSGLEDKATVQTRQNTYHNNVPQSIETRLDHINNIQANLKIAAGTSKVVAFNVQTSVDVLSSVVPVEKGAFMAIEALKISIPLAKGAAGTRVAGRWVAESTAGWSQRAMAYQEFVTGTKAGTAFEVGGVSFDGVRNNTLLEAKSSYDNFVNKKTGGFYSWFKGQNSLVTQARNQIKAANGSAIEWNFSSQKTLDATQKLFKDNNIQGITLKLNPQQ